MNTIDNLQTALDKIRHYLKEDGGDVEVLSIDEHGVVKIKMSGSCSTCLQKESTIKTGIETLLKDKFDFVTKVVEM